MDGTDAIVRQVVVAETFTTNDGNLDMLKARFGSQRYDWETVVFADGWNFLSQRDHIN